MAGIVLTCGIDEAGRGPLAGPVTAGCVVLPADFPCGILNDSKKLTEKRREAAEALIKQAACWGFGVVDHAEIDRINILQAALLAMKQAYDMMCAALPGWAAAHGIALGADAGAALEAIVDGTALPELPCPARAEPKADATYPAVMAASIIAKVGRDRMMLDYDRLYPAYGYARHKGYPTPAHKKICRELGPSPIQRLTFKY